MELFLVLLIAFIFLGPERMVDAARLLGKAVREARRMAAELPRLDLDEEVAPADARSRSTSGTGRGQDARRESLPPVGPAPVDERSESSGAADGPVAFQRESEASGEGGDERSAQAERP